MQPWEFTILAVCRGQNSLMPNFAYVVLTRRNWTTSLGWKLHLQISACNSSASEAIACATWGIHFSCSLQAFNSLKSHLAVVGCRADDYGLHFPSSHRLPNLHHQPVHARRLGSVHVALSLRAQIRGCWRRCTTCRWSSQPCNTTRSA